MFTIYLLRQSNKHKVYPRTEQYGCMICHYVIAVNNNVRSNMVYQRAKQHGCIRLLYCINSMSSIYYHEASEK